MFNDSEFPDRRFFSLEVMASPLSPSVELADPDMSTYDFTYLEAVKEALQNNILGKEDGFKYAYTSEFYETDDYRRYRWKLSGWQFYLPSFGSEAPDSPDSFSQGKMVLYYEPIDYLLAIKSSWHWKQKTGVFISIEEELKRSEAPGWGKTGILVIRVPEEKYASWRFSCAIAWCGEEDPYKAFESAKKSIVSSPRPNDRRVMLDFCRGINFSWEMSSVELIEHKGKKVLLEKFFPVNPEAIEKVAVALMNSSEKPF